MIRLRRSVNSRSIPPHRQVCVCVCLCVCVCARARARARALSFAKLPLMSRRLSTLSADFPLKTPSFPSSSLPPCLPHPCLPPLPDALPDLLSYSLTLLLPHTLTLLLPCSLAPLLPCSLTTFPPSYHRSFTDPSTPHPRTRIQVWTQKSSSF